MSGRLKSEVLKMRTLRSTWVVVVVAALGSAVLGVAQARIAADGGHDYVRLSTLGLGPVDALWFLVVVAAIIAGAGEFQHGTIRTTVLLTPRRRELLAVKSLATACFGAVVVASGILVAVSAGIVTALISGLSVSTSSAADVAHLAVAAALGAMWSVLATALGMITRSTAIAIAALLLWRFVGEALLPVLFSPHGEQILRWTPTGTARTLIGSAGLPLAAAAAVFVGYAVVLCSVAAVQFTRADPS